MTNRAFEEWAAYHRQVGSGGGELLWPSETLIRLFRGPYVPGLEKSFEGKKLVEVGVGNGNNLVFLNTLGLKLYGTEVLQEVCDSAAERMRNIGVDADIQPGTNQALPYEDNSFDFLVSWNVLHYEPTETDMVAAIAEYARVLKPGGRAFISTTGPDHMILEGAETLGSHRYRIGRTDDFRKGEVFFYFDSPNYIQHYFGTSFSEVLVGRTKSELFENTLDWYIVAATKN